jgi:iron only hydrogenase large subunit-like protein
MMSEQERLQQLLMPSQALSSSVSVYRRPDGSQVECRTDQQEWRQQQALPLITSSCPAVVCLLEKSAHAAVPHLSTTKSSMAAAGAYWKQQKQQQQHQLLKNGTIAPALPTTTTTNATAATTSTSTPAKSYFHLAIMPCHDKKLEASRKDFQEDASAESAKDVDMVITTSECFQLLLELLVASDAAATAATANSTSTATADAGASANPTSDANDTASHDNGSDKDAVAAAGIAMVRNYLESLPMAPVQESVGPCRPMTTTTTTTTLQLDNDNGIESTTTARTKESSATLMALPSTTTTAAATTTTTVTAKAAAKLVPSTASASTSNDAFFALGSGGYADFVFRYAAREIYGVDIDAVPWTPVTGAQVVAGGGGGGARPPQQRSARVATSAQRRRDFYQATLYRSSDGSYFTFDETTGTGPEVGGGGQSKSNEAVLRFAVAYGMQTIQRVFEPFQDKQQTGGGAASSSSTSMAAAPAPAAVSPYDYIEAMACPSGCLNGGGQNRVAERETPTETRQRVAKTTQFFVATNDDSQTSTSSSSNSTVAVAQAPLEPAQLVTSYHVVPPLELSMGAAAGVAVKDIEW